jgi:hypothetical protein
LSIAGLALVLPIPAFFKREENLHARSLDVSIKRPDVRYLDLQIKPAAEGIVQWRHMKTATRPCGFLEHQMRAFPDQIREPFFRPIEKPAKAEDADIDRE